MPKGLKMESARRAASGDVQVAVEVDGSDQGFLCDSCRTPVSWVRPHVVHGEDPELRRDVPAFFRLRTGGDHNVDCRYTAVGQLRQLVRESTAIEDEVNPFEQQEGQDLVFRVNIPQRQLRALRQNGEKTVPADEYVRRVERVWSGERLAPYCRSAVGLARLWALMDGSHEELSASVSIQENGKTIAWNDFFFPFVRYDSLANKVERKSLKHAAAALIVVRRHGVDRRGRPYIEGRGKASLRTSDNAIVAPRIYVPQNLLDRFEVGSRYIVFGRWTNFPNQWTSDETDVSYRFRNVVCNVYQAAQFCRVSVPGEGEDEE